MLLSATWPPARTSSRAAVSASSVAARVSYLVSRLSIRTSRRSTGSVRQPPNLPSSGTGKTSSGGGKPVSRRRVSILAERSSSAVSPLPSPERAAELVLLRHLALVQQGEVSGAGDDIPPGADRTHQPLASAFCPCTSSVGTFGVRKLKSQDPSVKLRR